MEKSTAQDHNKNGRTQWVYDFMGNNVISNSKFLPLSAYFLCFYYQKSVRELVQLNTE